jgi:hypothetical protein
VGGLGVVAMRFDCNPTQRAVVAVRSSQLRRPATLLPIPRYVLRVGAGIRAGELGFGRSSLLFRLGLGLSKLPWFLCTP